MNVNRLYVASIYINFFDEALPENKTNVKGMFLKKAIVYHDDWNNYIDLISGEKYKLGIDNTFLGDMYIYLKDGLIPIDRYYDISFDKDEMPKKKIVKKLSNANLLIMKGDKGEHN